MQAIREESEQSISHTRSRREASRSAMSQGRQETEDYDFLIHGPSHDAEPSTGHRHPPFPDIQSSHGTFSMSSVEGDQNNLDSSRHVTNTNSGNTTTSVTTNSNNDSSVRVRRRAYLLPPLHFFNADLRFRTRRSSEERSLSYQLVFNHYKSCSRIYRLGRQPHFKFASFRA
jgi:hypothetical protein